MRIARLRGAVTTAAVVLVSGLSSGLGAQGGPGALPGLPDPLPPLPLPLPEWFPPVWSQALTSPRPSSTTPGQKPATIPQYAASPDSTGRLATYQPGGPTVTAGNAFFMPLGTNGRSCFTCHQPRDAWGLTPASASATFVATQGKDPLFAPVDGANCPHTAIAAKTLSQKAKASSQLLLKGNIRVFLPIPANAQFKSTSPARSSRLRKSSAVRPSDRHDLHVPPHHDGNESDAERAGRPTPSSQGALMWDGREPSLESQFLDATLGHAQASKPPTASQISQGVTFETGLFTAQIFDRKAGDLTTPPAFGGPINLSRLPLPNQPFFAIPKAFDQFQLWAVSTDASQASINRGESLFNRRTFTVKGVAGFNDAVGALIAVGAVPAGTLNGPVTATCSTCHNNVNVGADTVGGGRHLGIGDNSRFDQSGNQTTATVLPPSSDQPLFAFDCPVGSIPFYSNPTKIGNRTYDVFQSSDPGMALISGRCADLGKFKVPRLNGLAARAPFFRGGNAASLARLVNFYDTRFAIGLTPQEKQDLINFLNSI